MKKKKINLILALILLILIIAVVIIGIIWNKQSQYEEIAEFVDDIEINYYSENVSYDDYYDKGIVKFDISEFVKLPENYLEYRITGETQEELQESLDEVMYSIVQNSEITIPNKFLNGLFADTYSDVKAAAQRKEQNIEEYIQSTYEKDNYKEFAQECEDVFESEIKQDMVYQALSKEFNITVEQKDIEEYYSKRIIEEGYNFEELKFMYGEQLLYRSALENKVKQELLKRLFE